jgi:hypothetical protein
MRGRGIATVPAVLLAAAAGLLTALFLSDWMTVDVRTTGEDAVHVFLPLPLAAGRVAAACVPDRARRDLQVPPEVRREKEQILAGLRALHDGPDATLVRVESPNAKVVVAKERNLLRVSVDADDGTAVRCTLPLDGVLDALGSWDWQTFDPALVVDVLAAAPHGDLVRVEADDGTKVAITRW